LLKAGGAVVPTRSLTRIAAVRLPEDFRADPGFTPLSSEYTARIFEQVGYRFDLRVCLKGIGRSDLLSDDAIFEDLDFRGPIVAEEAHEIVLNIHADGRADGFLVWLDLETAPGERLDILDHQGSWLPIYLPALPGVEVRRGDSIHAAVSRTLCSNALNPDYRIAGQIVRGGQRVFEFDYESRHFGPGYRQNLFYDQLFAGDLNRVRQAPGGTPTRKELRAHLQNVLPHYMIPADFVFLESLPLTPHGKIDRQALPAPPRPPAALARPRTPMEEALAAIWTEILEPDCLGVDDDFFALGGDSLQAALVAARIRQTLLLDVSLHTLFEHSTLADLARQLVQTLAEQTDAAELDGLLDELESS
jgi:hypothetical protein